MDEDYTEPCTCGGEHCWGIRYMQEDPFATEIHGDFSLYLMCDEDAWQSAEDI